MYIDDRFNGKLGDRIRESELIGASHIIIVGNNWISREIVGLNVNLPKSKYSADKTLQELKEYFENFEKTLTVPTENNETILHKEE